MKLIIAEKPSIANENAEIDDINTNVGNLYEGDLNVLGLISDMNFSKETAKKGFIFGSPIPTQIKKE